MDPLFSHLTDAAVVVLDFFILTIVQFHFICLNYANYRSTDSSYLT